MTVEQGNFPRYDLLRITEKIANEVMEFGAENNCSVPECVGILEIAKLAVIEEMKEVGQDDDD